jgi:hypothetical protein
MIFWSLCAFIWFRNMRKMLLQMTSGFLQLESTIHILLLSSGPVGDSQICHSKKNNDKLVKICLNIYFLQAYGLYQFSLKLDCLPSSRFLLISLKP